MAYLTSTGHSQRVTKFSNYRIVLLDNCYFWPMY